MRLYRFHPLVKFLIQFFSLLFLFCLFFFKKRRKIIKTFFDNNAP